MKNNTRRFKVGDRAYFVNKYANAVPRAGIITRIIDGLYDYYIDLDGHTPALPVHDEELELDKHSTIKRILDAV